MGLLLFTAVQAMAGIGHDHGGPAEIVSAGAEAATERHPVRDIMEVLLLKQYNTRLVVLSTMILGLASGFIGSFLLLRKRSLMGDALSHACLPGIAILFIVMVQWGGSGKALPGLLLGAVLTGVLGVWAVVAIRNTTKIKDDTAMGIVLSVFFGLGIAILGMIQEMPKASAAGLESFIYGKAASMVMQDFLLITVVAGVVLAATLGLRKEFTLLCFDEEYTAAIGWPLRTLDALLLALVTAVTVIGLQAVGLILIIAFLITPAAAARFWTDDLERMLLLAGGIGAISGWFGSSLSALTPGLPAGAVIVLVAAMVFLFSMFFGTARGVILRVRTQLRMQRKIGRQHILRAVYEVLESHSDRPEGELPDNHAVNFQDVMAKRSWHEHKLHRLIAQARKEDHIEVKPDGALQLSESGFGEATRITRNHRLWETYLITHAEVAPQLGPELVGKLEKKLLADGHPLVTLPSPHIISEEGAAT